MTIPLSPASDRRGPRETLLALTETYLRYGELDAAGRASVADLAARCGSGGSARPSGPTPYGPTAPGPTSPEWAPLAAALAAMLRGEATRALRAVSDAERGGRLPRALLGPMLGLGVRAALTTERPALASRWRALLARQEDATFPDSAQAAPRASRWAEAAVLATLPPLVRELLVVPGRGEVGADMDLAAGRGGAGVGDGAGAGAPSPEGDAPPAGGDDGPRLHLVLDAYRGDVVTLPVRVAVLAGGSGDGVHAAPDAQARDAQARDAQAPDAHAPELLAGLPLLTVRVAGPDPLPSPPEVAAWHVRFVGRLRALDARTSDGSLLALDWEPNGFVATFQPPEWLDELDPPRVLATRVTHVVVVPEV